MTKEFFKQYPPLYIKHPVQPLYFEVYVRYNSTKAEIGETKGPFKAMWDTGANKSVVYSRIEKATNCRKVKSTRKIFFGNQIQEGYEHTCIDIIIPTNEGKKLIFSNNDTIVLDSFKDNAGNILDTEDILIGTDIIGKGDFTLTNFETAEERITKVRFRHPSKDMEL